MNCSQLLTPLESPSGPPIVMLLRGRLGNQLFQYAAAVALRRSTRRNVLFHAYGIPDRELLLPLIAGPGFRRATTRELMLSGGWVPWDEPTFAARVFYGFGYRRLVRRRRRRSFGDCPGDAFAYDPAFEHLGTIRSIEGYFQHDSYWRATLDDVADSVATELAQLVDEPKSTAPTIGLHVRGSDYAGSGWMLPLCYYRRAIEIVLAGTGVGHAEVFGDDPALLAAVEEECRRAGLALSIPGSPRLRGPLQDLSRLASCTHLICSNSTFAWWAACLGDRTCFEESRVVVVPEPWLDGQITSLARRGWVQCAVPGWELPTAR
jgi:hypothetical protein